MRNKSEDYLDRKFNNQLLGGLAGIIGFVAGGALIGLCFSPNKFETGDFNKDGIADIRYETFVGEVFTIYGLKDQEGNIIYSKGKTSAF